MNADQQRACPLHLVPMRRAEINGREALVCMFCIAGAPAIGKNVKGARTQSLWEEELQHQIRITGLPDPEREFRFAKPRRYRADFAWPAQKILAEVEGGIYTGGRHTRGKGYEEDCRKYNLAVELGWRVLRFTPKDIQDGRAIATLETLLARAE